MFSDALHPFEYDTASLTGRRVLLSGHTAQLFHGVGCLCSGVSTSRAVTCPLNNLGSGRNLWECEQALKLGLPVQDSQCARLCVSVTGAASHNKFSCVWHKHELSNVNTLVCSGDVVKGHPLLILLSLQFVYDDTMSMHVHLSSGMLPRSICCTGCYGYMLLATQWACHHQGHICVCLKQWRSTVLKGCLMSASCFFMCYIRKVYEVL